MIGFGLMFAMYKLGELYTRRIAQKQGEEFDEAALGFGDVNLSGIIGLILGWPGVIVGLFLGVVLGGVFSLFYLIFRKVTKKYQAYEAIAYAPYLVLGTILILYFRNLFQ
jgi:leader peptidase (prepilin peptidase)/N-methyltransferase